MAWILLLVSGLFEVLWAASLKEMGFSSPRALWWSAANVLTLLVITYCMNRATQTVPVATAYVVFTGIGTLGAVAIDIWVYKEAVSLQRLFFLALLAGSILGVKATTPTAAPL